ncbi:MAG TPA: phosphoglucosamine mutase [Saprospiraceae bacterium]|nr:phosphoglucosamine mutase [Saprospiraceae bacterium]
MALKETVSGFRGTFGNKPGNNLTPYEIVNYAATYGNWLTQQFPDPKIVVGRDGRITGEIVSELAINTLLSMGVDVIDLGYSTTPTVEMAVTHHGATGGIIFTASHNPKEWNAFKFLNQNGEFLSAQSIQLLLDNLQKRDHAFADVDRLGVRTKVDNEHAYHIQKVLEDDLVDVDSVKEAKYKVVVDTINSTGAMIIPELLEQMGCEVVLINGKINGKFAHNPEPVEKNLRELTKVVVSEKANLGIAVDPDVDRLVFVSEKGDFFGEEYTLVAVADYVLSKKKGAVVSNMSSSYALADIAQKHNGQRYESPVGEVHVVQKMKEVNAVIGGEGNGGVIYPPLHYGRDAVIGIALFLTHMAHSGRKASSLRNSYPSYYLSKNKVQLPQERIVEVIERLQEKYKKYKTNTDDGLKIYLDAGWVHIRASNTEPIMRIISESTTPTVAENLSEKIMMDIGDMVF